MASIYPRNVSTKSKNANMSAPRNWKPDQPYNDLPRLPPAVGPDTKTMLKQCIKSNAALAESKQAAESIPKRAMLINTLPLLGRARRFRNRKHRHPPRQIVPAHPGRRQGRPRHQGSAALSPRPVRRPPLVASQAAHHPEASGANSAMTACTTATPDGPRGQNA